ncbi:uncharacterized protein LOC130235471 isoform X2 [Danio aesculapii]|uniref:uncharacterized protein LOC130235471 isoform X2 n=1 Tax=Danio aesculapii TaxID=1142201 RepID=UPI0024BF94F9|nr:uncharacterized protein LOC130235471 isoform X2 [Danio aesculapii]
MAKLQTWLFHLDLIVIIILLIHADFSKSKQEPKIQQHINKTVFVGETVTLHCNKTDYDDDFTWTVNSSVIFRLITYSKLTYSNFSSNRTYVNPTVPRELKIQQIQVSDAGKYTCYPAAIRWTLTITENQTTSVSFKLMPLFIFIIIIISCFGVILICLIITINICFHRKQGEKMNSDLGKDLVKLISDHDQHTITVCVYRLHTVS